MMNQLLETGIYAQNGSNRDIRALAADLRSKVINDPSVPLDLRRVSLRAACALQVMSDRNFEKAPAKVKADCRTALSDCMSAWADHGAQVIGG